LSKKRKLNAQPKLERFAVFQPQFRDDLRHGVATDRLVALRVFDLIEAIMRDPFTGHSSISVS
jgi:toxin YoeB